MSEAKWCDQGNHAFSALDRDAQTITVTMQAADAYGRPHPVSLTKDICGKCANTIKLLAITEPDETKEESK